MCRRSRNPRRAPCQPVRGSGPKDLVPTRAHAIANGQLPWIRLRSYMRLTDCTRSRLANTSPGIPVWMTCGSRRRPARGRRARPGHRSRGLLSVASTSTDPPTSEMTSFWAQARSPSTARRYLSPIHGARGQSVQFSPGPQIVAHAKRFVEVGIGLHPDSCPQASALERESACPNGVTEPRRGISTPVSSRTVVVLPAPLGPSSPNARPVSA